MIFTDFPRYFLDYLLNFLHILYKLDLPETGDFTWTFHSDVGSPEPLRLARGRGVSAVPLAAGGHRPCARSSGAPRDLLDHVAHPVASVPLSLPAGRRSSPGWLSL